MLSTYTNMSTDYNRKLEHYKATCIYADMDKPNNGHIYTQHEGSEHLSPTR